jgi:hypothetical protein
MIRAWTIACGLTAILAALAADGLACAQTTSVDPVVVTAKRPPDCTPAKGANGGDAPNYACLNAQLAHTAASAAPQPAGRSTFDIAGAGQPNKVGTFSWTGTAEMLGSNFGKSAFPQRPPPPARYSPPLSASAALRPK